MEVLGNGCRPGTGHEPPAEGHLIQRSLCLHEVTQEERRQLSFPPLNRKTCPVSSLMQTINAAHPALSVSVPQLGVGWSLTDWTVLCLKMDSHLQCLKSGCSCTPPPPLTPRREGRGRQAREPLTSSNFMSSSLCLPLPALLPTKLACAEGLWVFWAPGNVLLGFPRALWKGFGGK